MHALKLGIDRDTNAWNNTSDLKGTRNNISEGGKLFLCIKYLTLNLLKEKNHSLDCLNLIWEFALTSA